MSKNSRRSAGPQQGSKGSDLLRAALNGITASMAAEYGARLGAIAAGKPPPTEFIPPWLSLYAFATALTGGGEVFFGEITGACAFGSPFGCLCRSTSSEAQRIYALLPEGEPRCALGPGYERRVLAEADNRARRVLAAVDAVLLHRRLGPLALPRRWRISRAARSTLRRALHELSLRLAEADGKPTAVCHRRAGAGHRPSFAPGATAPPTEAWQEPGFVNLCVDRDFETPIFSRTHAVQGSYVATLFGSQEPDGKTHPVCHPAGMRNDR